MKETIRLFREGKSREEIMEILGIAKSTVNEVPGVVALAWEILSSEFST
jgi:hypothetical protein